MTLNWKYLYCCLVSTFCLAMHYFVAASTLTRKVLTLESERPALNEQVALEGEITISCFSRKSSVHYLQRLLVDPAKEAARCRRDSTYYSGFTVPAWFAVTFHRTFQSGGDN